MKEKPGHKNNKCTSYSLTRENPAKPLFNRETRNPLKDNFNKIKRKKTQ